MPVLRVFISSPGDCEPERQLVSSVVRRLSDTDDARRRRITLEPTTWEELPPGPAEDAGYQARIDALMKRYGRDRFEIYVGFMKDRLGTPTGSYMSGTVAELEAALQRRARTGLPAEVLFYFFRPDGARPPEVERFAEDLRSRRFLYAVAPTSADFEAQVTTHLTTVVREWFEWRNRAARLVRRSRRVAALLAMVAVLAWCATDLLPAWRLTGMLQRAGPEAAAAAWADARPFMLTTGERVRRAINAELSAAVIADSDALRALDRYARWYASPVYAAAQDAARGPLGERIADVLEQATVAAGDGRAEVARWREAVRMKLLDADEAGAIVTAIASKRLFSGLLAEGLDPQDWHLGLHDHEIAALGRFARGIVAVDGNAAGWTDRQARHAIVVLAGDWNAAEAAATRALHSYDTPEQPEIDYFVRRAPALLVRAWLSDVFGSAPNVASHRVARVVDAVVARADPDVVLALVDVVASGGGGDAAVGMLDDVTCPVPACAGGATERLRVWATGDGTLPTAVVDVLLRALDPNVMASDERVALARRLLERDDPGASAVVIRALAALRTAAANRFLTAEIERHVHGHVFFASAQRAALIDAAGATGHKAALSWARQLAMASLRDSGESDASVGSSFGRYDLLVDPRALRVDPGEVLAAYVRSLAEHGAATEWSRHQATIEAVLEWRFSDGGAHSIYREEVDDAMSALFDVVGDERAIGLLRFLPPPRIDPPWSPVWTRREYIVGVTVRGLSPSPTFCAAVGANVAGTDEMLRRFDRLMPSVGAACIRAYVSASEPRATEDALRLLAASGDVDGVAERLASIRTAAERTAAARAILASTADVPEEAKAPLVGHALGELLSESPTIDRSVLRAAATAHVQTADLAAAGESIVRSSTIAGELAAAFAYFASGDGARFWALMEDEATARSLRVRLEGFDAFDWETATQELPDPPADGIPRPFVDLATARASLSVREGQPRDADSNEDRMFCFDGGRAFDPALATLVATRTPSETLTKLVAIGLGGDPSVRSLSAVAAIGTLYRAYVLWLAGLLEARETRPQIPTGLLTALADGNARIGRAAAGVVLAAPAAAYAAADPAMSNP